MEIKSVIHDFSKHKRSRMKKKKGTRKKISCLDIGSKCSGPSLSQDTSYYLLSPAKVVRKQKTENYSSVPRHNEQKRRGRWRVARRGVRQGVQSNDLCLPWQLAPSERYLPFDFSFSLFLPYFSKRNDIFIESIIWKYLPLLFFLLFFHLKMCINISDSS